MSNETLDKFMNGDYCNNACSRVKTLTVKNDKYKQAIENILRIICEFGKHDIVTFPDLKPKQNYEIIMKQFNKPLLKILKECAVLEDLETIEKIFADKLEVTNEERC